MPETFKAFSRETAADEYEILIREDLPDLEKAAVFLHEMLHIWHNDHNSDLSGSVIETIHRKEMMEILKILTK